jgi:hypothetical protein
VVDVRDAVDDADDLALERVRLARPRVRQDPVADLSGEVQLLGDPKRLLVVPKPAPEAPFEHFVERRLAGVPERRVAGVMTEADRLDEVLVQAQRASDAARDRGRLERVRHPRAVVVAGRVDEDLRLPLQSPERLRVQDPVSVALERRPQQTRLLGTVPPARLVRPHGERREPRLLVLANARLESVRHCSRHLGHELQPTRRRGDH